MPSLQINDQRLLNGRSLTWISTIRSRVRPKAVPQSVSLVHISVPNTKVLQNTVLEASVVHKVESLTCRQVMSSVKTTTKRRRLITLMPIINPSVITINKMGIIQIFVATTNLKMEGITETSKLLEKKHTLAF